MKKILIAALVAAMTFTGCKGVDSEDIKSEDIKSEDEPGNQQELLDLTEMSSTMVYSEVFNIVMNPEEYLGREIKMNGSLFVYQEEITGKTYYSCIISDATACCAQGIEFQLADETAITAGDINAEDEITVQGIFETYSESGYVYCRLADAKLE